MSARSEGLALRLRDLQESIARRLTLPIGTVVALVAGVVAVTVVLMSAGPSTEGAGTTAGSRLRDQLASWGSDPVDEEAVAPEPEPEAEPEPEPAPTPAPTPKPAPPPAARTVVVPQADIPTPGITWVISFVEGACGSTAGTVSQSIAPGTVVPYGTRVTYYYSTPPSSGCGGGGTTPTDPCVADPSLPECGGGGGGGDPEPPPEEPPA